MTYEQARELGKQHPDRQPRPPTEEWDPWPNGFAVGYLGMDESRPYYHNEYGTAGHRAFEHGREVGKREAAIVGREEKTT